MRYKYTYTKNCREEQGEELGDGTTDGRDSKSCKTE